MVAFFCLCDFVEKREEITGTTQVHFLTLCTLKRAILQVLYDPLKGLAHSGVLFPLAVELQASNKAWNQQDQSILYRLDYDTLSI